MNRILSSLIWLLPAGVLCAVFASLLNAKDVATTRKTPPTIFLSFDKSLEVDSVYIYPDTIGIRPTAELAGRARARVSFSNLPERNAYEHTSEVSLDSADPAFWIAFPDDCPSEVAVDLKLLKAAEQGAAANP